MAAGDRRTILKSYAFRSEREATWRELDQVVRKAESGGVRALTPRELLRLPNLYRATVSSLSVARNISLDRNVVDYLESLCARAFFFVYGAHENFLVGVARFFARRFPRAVRAARWHIALAALCLALGGVAGFSLTAGNQDWYYTFVPAGMAQERTPTASTESLRAGLYDGGEDAAADQLTKFASFLFTHNAGIGLLAFALGFALGLPTTLAMVYNGMILGAFAALYHLRGLSGDLWGWLLIHGTTELLAVAVCGGAGLVLAGSVIVPGRHSRMEALARNGKRAAEIAMGAVAMFFVAGLLEGFARQLVTDLTLRYVIAGLMLVLWLAYFTLAGRSHGDDDG